MLTLLHAILAAGLVAAASPPDERASPPGEREVQPRRVSFRLQDGVRIAGDLSTWDDEGFRGTFGRRLWHELHVDDLWQVYFLVMDRESVAQWVNLGRIYLNMEGQARHRDRAFAQARRLHAEEADALIEAVQRAREERLAAERQAERERLKSTSPEAGPWPAGAWPSQTAQERAAALRAIRATAGDLARTAELTGTPVETPRILLHHGIEQPDASHWARAAETMIGRLNETFNEPPEHDPFWGKLVILLSTDHDRFRLTQAAAFQQLVPLATTWQTTYDGPRTFIHLVVPRDRFALEANLRSAITLAYLHRHRSALRLPEWAHAGFAAYTASRLYEELRLPCETRELGLTILRNERDAASHLARSWAENTWPGPRGEGDAIGLLMVSHLLEHHRAAFLAWINAVKAGEPWEEALRAHLGVTPARLFERTVAWYRVND